MVSIREIREEDAPAFLDLGRQLDQETKFLMLEPGERQITVDEQRERIRGLFTRDNQTIFVAEADGKLVGYLAALGGAYRRNRATVHIVIGILQAHTGQGLGTRLFVEVERWARERNIHRLELTLMAHNERALALYKKMGFEMEGTKRESLCVEGVYVDEYYMSKLLS